MPLTEKIIEKLRLRPPSSGRAITFDNEIQGPGQKVPGFGVYVTAGGVVTFFVDYRIHGRQRRYSIGRWPEVTVGQARQEASDLRGEVRQGHDPLAQREQSRTAPTVAELAEEYTRRVHKRPTSARNDRQMLDSLILPKLGKLQLVAATKQDVEDLHRSLDKTPYRANRVLALLSAMFRCGMEWGWCSGNPAHGIPRFPEEKRERWLNREEITRLLQALDQYPDQNAADAIRLLLFTGSREGEVLDATWDEFDLDRGTWTKPSHHTKQKRTEHVPLNRPAMEVLRRLHDARTGSHLFPGGDGNGSHRVTLRRPWVQACKAAGLVEVEQVPGKRRHIVIRYKPAVRIHDLRHTFASHLVSGGASLQIVGGLLGHTLASTTQRYAHLSDGALRDASNQFERLALPAVGAEDIQKGTKMQKEKKATRTKTRHAGAVTRARR